MRHRIELRAMAGALVCLVGLAACSATRDEGPRPQPSATGAPTLALEAQAYVRPCDTSVYGAMPRGWEHDAVVVGPIALVGLGPDGAISARALDQRPGRVEGLKVLVVVAARTRVTVSIDRRSADRLALLYDPAAFNSRRIRSGERAVVFPACHGGGTRFDGSAAVQFNGGLIVDGDVCGHLLVRWEAGSRTVPLALGRAC